MQLSHSGLSVQFDVFIIAVNRARIENKQIVSWCERKTWLAHFMLLLLFVFRFSSLRSFMLNAHSGSSSSSVVRMFSDFSLSSSLVWDICALCVYFETIAYTIHNFAAIDQLLAIRSRETVLFLFTAQADLNVHVVFCVQRATISIQNFTFHSYELLEYVGQTTFKPTNNRKCCRFKLSFFPDFNYRNQYHNSPGKML